MSALRKITVQIPERDLELAQQATGQGVTETVRIGLKQIASAGAQRRLLNLRGKVKFAMSVEELRHDRE